MKTQGNTNAAPASYGNDHAHRTALIGVHKSSCGNTMMIVPTLQRGNASQDAPRPLLNAVQMHAQAPALSTSCARLTESAICAICDAERHGRHATQSDGHDQW